MARNVSGTYALYTPGNPVVTGTVISSTVQNATLNDIATALTQSIASTGVTTPTANLPMGAYRHTGVGNANAQACYGSVTDIQNGSLITLSAVAGVDTITATAPLTVAAYAAGQSFQFVSAGTNTGAVTINISGLGAKAVTKLGATALAAGDIPSGGLIKIVYDGTQFQAIGGLKTFTYKGTAAATVDLLTGANIASASTIDLDAATGNRVHVTGTTTITAVTLTRGPRTVIFDGILTLTHNATTNSLPGGANITTAAGDVALYESDGTTVRCVAYTKADGRPVNMGNTSAAGGTADAITGTYTPSIPALVNGMVLYVRAASANATTTPTFTPASGVITAKTIVKGNGLALAAGDIAGAGHWLELQYDLSLDKWSLLNPATFALFGNSLASPGYQKLPGGLILQWGALTTDAAGTAVTFPVAFTTALYVVTITAAAVGPVTTSAAGGSTTGFTAYAASSVSTNWIAIGK